MTPSPDPAEALAREAVDPQRPETWPRVCPAEPGWYLAMTPSEGAPDLVQPWKVDGAFLCVGHASGAMKLPMSVSLFNGWRWFPAPITPMALAQSERLRAAEGLLRECRVALNISRIAEGRAVQASIDALVASVSAHLACQPAREAT